MTYQLESGDSEEQKRYDYICNMLEQTGTTRYRVANTLKWTIPEARERIKHAVILLLESDGALPLAKVVDALAHTAQRIHIKYAIAELRDAGILVCHGKKLHFLAPPADDTHPLDVGAPIIFMPGMRSQQTGEIVRIQHLKSHGIDVPVAKLASGTEVFVQPQLARVDLSQLADDNARAFVYAYIREHPQCTRNNIAAALHKATIKCALSALLQDLVGDKLVCRMGRGIHGGEFLFVAMDATDVFARHADNQLALSRKHSRDFRARAKLRSAMLV